VSFERFVEILYGVDNGLLVGALFALILVCNELGFRFGLRRGRTANEGVKSQTHAIQAAILGLLALLLGFSFSMGLQRFDSRSEAVIAEANAIGTAYLRATLVPEPQGEMLRARLRAYLDLRVEAGHVDLTRIEGRQALNERAMEMQSDLWRVAAVAARKDPNPVTTGLFLQALNELIDAYGSRQAALQKHIPEVVLFLMFGVFAITGAILGYSSGLEGARPRLATLAITVLIVLVVFLIVDLDRPRRGLIQVDQSALSALRSALTDGTFELSPSGDRRE
jgi:hypothetical protein